MTTLTTGYVPQPTFYQKENQMETIHFDNEISMGSEYPKINQLNLSDQEPAQAGAIQSQIIDPSELLNLPDEEPVPADTTDSETMAATPDEDEATRNRRERGRIASAKYRLKQKAAKAELKKKVYGELNEVTGRRDQSHASSDHSAANREYRDE
ncbi:hypothetical protein AJ80_08397 [Polytolypa hystricis UAMH7299]|uniref:BZIP domain-containing protein n=1 Tax=Polytolypa hystricis (strain UAMH7299) TaxID=1447883 RepID=A0A2B7X8R1_POLH7|nr:hypothetical protein AJ80_08397 [Polytolypa hystricis UAMH7299]